MKSTRLTIAETDKYKVDVEYNEFFAILHLPFIKQLNKETYKALVKKFQELKDFFQEVGYDKLWIALEPEKTVLTKFISRLGFSFVADSGVYKVYNVELN